MTDIKTVDKITSEVDLFAPILLQTILLNEFDREFAPLASLQEDAPIEFMVTGADQLYLDLNESSLHLHVKITNADGTNIGANTAGPVNLMLHSLLSQMSVEFNGKPVNEQNHLYAYRAYFSTLINNSEETQKTRLLTEGWTKDTEGHMEMTDVARDKQGLRSRAAHIATSRVVKLIGCPQLDVFQQDRLILPNVDVYLKLIPSAKNFFASRRLLRTRNSKITKQ